MKLLAVETSTDVCSVALSINGHLLEDSDQAAPGHARSLLPMIELIMRQAGTTLAEIDAIAVGKGPGAFTGLRVGVGVVQGLAFAHDLPVIPVSSLAGLAQGQFGGNILVAQDARMGQIYWGAYRRDEGNLVELDGEELVCFPAEVPIPADSKWTGIGSGWEVYRDDLANRLGSKLIDWIPSQRPKAADLTALASRSYKAGNWISAEHSVPDYIRNQVVVKS